MSSTPSLMDQLSAHVQHGDHICVVCEDPQERLRAAAQYIADGLRRDEFVMYAAPTATSTALRTLLADAGIDVAQAVARGALQLPDPYDAYLVDGRFDPDAMYTAFENAIDAALAAGFSGCRFAGEPTWALEHAELRPGLIEFEARLNTLFRGKKAAGFCVYDKQTWPAEVVRDILRTHPVAVVDDLVCKRNIYYERPDAAATDVSAAHQVDWMLSQLREIRTYEARLQVAVDAGRLGTWELDLEDDVVECSRRHDEIFGYARTVGHWRRAQLLAHVLPEERDQVAAAIDDAIASGKECRIEYRIERHGDGAVRWLEMHGRLDPPGSRGRQAQRMLGITSDITERKEMEGALRDTDRRKDEFLATLAHELRNPLAPIFNVLHLLQMKYPASDDLQRMHGVLDRQVRHLSHLVDDLMDVSRITTGRIVLRRERVDLRTVLAGAVESAQPLIDAARHACTLALPPQPVLVDGDPTRLAQVFLNIVTNAAKYTPRGGRIALSLALDERQVTVSVVDNGVGLDPALVPKMFDMFVQGHRVGDHAQGGLGIGLSLSKQLVALHGGAISASSAGLGHGCEVAVSLPLAAPAGAAGAPDGAGPAARASGARRVLVVDDNVDAADTLAASLEFIGHDVRTRYAGAAALDEATRWTPDVAILDIGMPGMDGYALAARLRALAPSVRLVALSGWGQEADLRRAVAAGFDEHRTKPVNLSDLMAVIAAPRAA